ncbi:MAG: VOC family protein [Chloroflexota bacterium]
MTTQNKPTTNIDHIIYTTPDLQQGIDEIEALFGERPYFGGQHLGKGSHNALLSLGKDVYLEIIAPDPQQPEPESSRSFALDSRSKPQLATWAAATNDMSAIIEQAIQAGYDPGKLTAGGRLTDDGVQLSWQSTRRVEASQGKTPPGDWLIPFVIYWGDTPHPASSKPSQCRLITLEATHPNPASIQQMLSALGLTIQVTQSDQIGLKATLDTPNGRVVLK